MEDGSVLGDPADVELTEVQTKTSGFNLDS